MKSLIIIALALAPATALAQREALAPLVAHLPLGARSAALGGATAAITDAEAALVNPALAGTFTTTALSVVNYRPGTAGAVVATGAGIGRFGVAFAASYLDYLALGPTEKSPVADDVLQFRGFDPSASLHAAMSLSTVVKGVRVGASATYLEERAALDRASTLAATLGAARRVGPVMVGVALQNLGPSMRFGAQDVELPSRLAIGASGASMPLGAWFDVQVEAGMAIRQDGVYTASGGAELAYTPIEGLSVALRAGARRPELSRQAPLTGGGGVTLDRLTLDYAFESLRGGMAHRIGFRLR